MLSPFVASLLLAAAPEVSLDEALRRAMTQNAQLKVLRADVEVASASIGLAHDWNLPKLRVQFNDVQDIPSANFRWWAGLSWEPPNPWEWKSGDDGARAKLRQQELQLAAEGWKLVRDLRLGWLDVSGAAAHEQVARETVGVRSRLVALLKRRVDQGHGTQLDVNLAQLGAADAEQDVLRWQSAGLKAAQTVSYLVGEPLTPTPLPLPDAPPELPALETFEGRLDRHPALEAVRFKVSAGEAEEKRLAAKRLPWPEWQARVRQSVNAPAPATHDFQLGLAVPLGVTPAPELDVARAVTARNRSQLEAERAQRVSELRILHARAVSLRERWASFDAGFKATIASHRALQQRVLNDGSLDPTALMTADRQAIDLEHKRLEVQLDLARTLVELEAVAGPQAP